MDKRPPNRDAASRAQPVEVYPDRVYPDRVYPDRVYPDRVYPDRVFPDKAFTVAAVAAWLVLVALLGLAVGRQSLIGDAAYHLLAGDQALRHGNNQLNLEHPPLVKLLAALPLLGEKPLSPPVGVDRAIDTSLELFADPARVRRAQLRSRTLLAIVFALPLLACCLALGSRWGGPRAGGVLALAVGLSFAVLPFLPVIQTDTAVTLGFVATALALLRYLDAPGPTRALVAGAALGLALAAKHSGVLLVPSVLFVLLAAGPPGGGLEEHIPRGRRAPLRGMIERHLGRGRLRDLALVAVASGAVLYATYGIANRDYESRLGRDTIERYLGGEGMITGQEMRRHAELLLGAERVDPNLAQWLTGLLGIRAQNQIGVYPSYAFGSVSSRGRWWYFPAVLLIKTPLPLLAASLAALVAWLVRRRRSFGRGAALLVLTTGIYLGVAVTSSYNLGVRHLMPILPFLYLPAASWAARSRIRTAVLVAALAVEALILAPLWMSATNTWWLGSRNPTRFALSGSDTDYHQNFIALESAARSRGIETLHVLYPLLDEEELQAYVPGARLVAPGSPLESGQWYAVSILVEQYLPAIPRADPGELLGADSLASLTRAWTPLWEQVARGEDHGYVAGTFHLYRLPFKQHGP